MFPEKLKPFAERWIKAIALTEEMLRLKAGPLVTDIIRNMKRVIEKPSEEVLKLLEILFHTPAAKLFVFSGHDTTLSPMLDALGLFNGKIPPYAASLYFELHEISEKYYVKVTYSYFIFTNATISSISTGIVSNLKKMKISLLFYLHFSFKVFYRPDIQKPAEEQQLKRCNSSPCLFEDFMKTVDPYILDEKQWAEECRD